VAIFGTTPKHMGSSIFGSSHLMETSIFVISTSNLDHNLARLMALIL